MELNGWQEIARHLAVSVRTAQVYERDLGLPAHRRPGSKGRVWAVTEELDGWKKSKAPSITLNVRSAPPVGGGTLSTNRLRSIASLAEPTYSQKTPKIPPHSRASASRHESDALHHSGRRAHRLQVIIIAILYGLMLAVTVLMELAYRFDKYGQLAFIAAPLVFVWTTAAVLVTIAWCRKYVREGRPRLAAASALILVFAAAVNGSGMCLVLPDMPLTQASFQTWTAQSAYLKGVVYCTGFVVFVALAPFHFIGVMQYELKLGRQQECLDLLLGSRMSVSPKGAPFIRPWVFVLFLLFGAVYSLISSAHLLEALQVTQYTNLFIDTIQLRWALFLLLGGECCWWYYAELEEIKRECLGMLNAHGVSASK